MFFYKKTTEIRKNKGISQRQIAEMIGKSLRTYIRWETGESNPTAFYIRSIAKVLDIPISEISDLEEAITVNPLFYDKLGTLDKATYTFSTKTESEKQQMFIELQSQIEILLRENKDFKTNASFYSSILNEANALIFRKDRSMRFTYVNNSFLKYFNISNESHILEKRVEEIPEINKIWAGISIVEKEVINTETIIKNSRVKIPRKDVGSNKCLITISPTLNDDGNLFGIVGTVFDVTGYEAAREKYYYLESALDKIEHVIWIIKKEPYFHYIYINNAVENVYGIGKENFYGNVKKWKDFIIKEDLKKVESELKENIDEIEYRITDAKGVLKWIIHNRYSTEISGELFEFGVIKDITYHKEQQLFKDMLKANISAMHGGFAVYDINKKKWLYLNDFLEEITGYTNEFIKNSEHSFWSENIVHPAFRENYQAWLSSNSDDKYFEYKIITKNGIEKWISESERITVFQKTTCRTTIISDITEKKRSDERSDVLKVFIDSIPYGVSVTDELKKKGLYVNEAYEMITGYSAKEIVNDINIFKDKIVHPDFKDEYIKFINSNSSKEFKIITKNGEEKWVEVLRMFKTFECSTYRIVIMKDITCRKFFEDDQLFYTDRIAFLGEGFFIIDTEKTEYIYVSNGISKITGYTTEFLTKKGPDYFTNSIVVPEDRERISKFRQDKTKTTTECKISRADGTIKSIKIERKTKKIKDKICNIVEIKDISSNIS